MCNKNYSPYRRESNFYTHKENYPAQGSLVDSRRAAPAPAPLRSAGLGRAVNLLDRPVTRDAQPCSGVRSPRAVGGSRKTGRAGRLVASSRWFSRAAPSAVHGKPPKTPLWARRAFQACRSPPLRSDASEGRFRRLSAHAVFSMFGVFRGSVGSARRSGRQAVRRAVRRAVRGSGVFRG